MLSGHGGGLPEKALRAGIRPEEIIDFSISVNTPPDGGVLRQKFEEALSAIPRYPDPHYARLRAAISEKYGLTPGNVVVGNGSTELLYLIPRVFTPKSALVLAPSYADYADSARFAGADVRRFFLEEKSGFKIDEKRFLAETKTAGMVIIGNPNNPTGGIIGKELISRAAEEAPDAVFLVDESFADYAPEASLLRGLLPNMIILRSFTKFYGIPGLRLGFSASTPQTTLKILDRKEPWTVNCVAESFAMSFLKGSEETDARIRGAAISVKNELFDFLRTITQLEVFPSRANFVLVKIRGRVMSASMLQDELLKRGKLVRDCSNFEGLDEYFFRIGAKTSEENASLVEALRAIFSA